MSRTIYARYFLFRTNILRTDENEAENSNIYRQNAKIKSIKQILAVDIECVCVSVLWNYHGRLFPTSEWIPRIVSFIPMCHRPTQPLDFNRLCLNSFQWAQLLYTWSLHLPGIHSVRGQFFFHLLSIFFSFDTSEYEVWTFQWWYSMMCICFSFIVYIAVAFWT